MPDDRDALEEMAHELMQRFDALGQEFLVPQQSANLSRVETALLRLLADSPATMSAIGTSLGVPLSSATGLIDRLVERGLVERTRPAEDRRRVTVALTPKGRRALEALQRDRTRLGIAVLERLSPRERQTLLELFRKTTR